MILLFCSKKTSATVAHLVRYIAIFIIFGGCFTVLNLPAQPLKIGQWRSHLAYDLVNAIAVTNQMVYAGTQTGLFSYDINTHEITTYSTVEGLSEMNIVGLNWHEPTKTLLIVYDSGNIDLLQNNATIRNISDIKRSFIAPQKKLAHVHPSGDFAYLSFNFGIVVFDLVKQEFKDTYVLYDGNMPLPIENVATGGGEIWAATANGFYRANLNSTNLSNFNVWQTVYCPLDTTKNQTSHCVTFSDNLFWTAIGSNVVSYNPKLQLWASQYKSKQGYTIKIINADTTNNQIYWAEWLYKGKDVINRRLITLNPQNQQADTTYHWLMQRPASLYRQPDGNFWVADNWASLIFVTKDGSYGNRIYPPGPLNNSVYAVYAHNKNYWTVGGSITSGWNYTFNPTGIFRYNNGAWTAYNQNLTPTLQNTYDYICAAFDPARPIAYFGTYGWGLVECNYANPDDIQFKVITNNEGSTLESALGDPNSFRISGLDYDAAGNLWVTNFGAYSIIACKKANGNWQSYQLADDAAGLNSVYGMLVDDYNQKWMVARNKGLIVFNHGTSLENTTDDNYAVLTNVQDQGSLPSDIVYCMAKDKDGAIWLGTASGVGVIYCPYAVMEGKCETVKPIIEVDGYPAYLLENETVTAIAVDGANRKWIGSERGLFLLNADGSQQIAHYTTDNSPLPSNYVFSIAIEPNSGEVIIATDKGIISFKSDATEGAINPGGVLVYPNPVRPQYIGPIAINGLSANANVKITDVNGQLVYETYALGTQAVWYATDYQGRRVKSGIYLVFSVDATGQQTQVAKIAVIS
ncbi:MAG: hypothetical protein IPI59_00715 [Sphingobacteriales bacterium]|jgi:ligand-binding sensor domain-containing protein|nr:hypothetical protein [Sphingobacteriales bacterium]MBP9141252.1 hypothetical protein [Chitinophagales bacterium]MDA0197916.1 hypothetical protein [Bacteroidota bacterium]MBK6890854.1 hypothetical protein [Sphingobacteriales bacterium]MBK7526093.1 hypothetical protein [Sphingobacteriales bacterium]